MHLINILLAQNSEENATAMILVILALIVAYFASYRKERIGNWSHLFSNMQHDPKVFYDHVVEYLKEHEVPEFQSEKITFEQFGFLSHRRLYLQVSRGDYVYHICAAPWGTDFFFSWWLNFRIKNFSVFLLKIPIVRSITKTNENQAYYKLDTETMFRTSVQQAVLAAIDAITVAKGIRGLTELERKPDLRSFIK